MAGFFEKDPEGAVEGGFVGQTAVWQEEVGLCEAVGEEQEQTFKVGFTSGKGLCVRDTWMGLVVEWPSQERR